jgi:DNA-binding transcriptional LysR family regulator
MQPYRLDHLRLRLFTLVVTLADTGSLHQAARRMNTSQPSLSIALRDAESALGGKLFERSRRGLLPTEMGAYTIRQARLILADLCRLQDEFALGRDGHALLRVGALPLTMLEIIPRALASLRRTEPALRVEFHEDAASELLAALASGSLDLVVGRMLPEFAANIDLEPAFLFNESFCVISGTHHPFAKRRRIAWIDLRASDWIQSPSNTALSDYFVEAFLRRGLTPALPIYQSASFYSCIAILLTSNCLMMVPREVGRHFARQSAIRILSIKIGEASAPFSIIKRRSRAATHAMIAFEKAVQQALRGRSD